MKVPFSKLSKAEKRIVILKDALRHLNAKRILANTGAVIGVEGTHIDNLVGCQLQSIIKEKKCMVCQRGALLFSMVYRTNDFVVTRKYANKCMGAGFEFGVIQGEDDLIDPYLKNLFTENQLKLMECAFERGYYHEQLKEYDAASAFGDKFDTPNDRMEAILKNAIKNKGIFKP